MFESSDPVDVFGTLDAVFWITIMFGAILWGLWTAYNRAADDLSIEEAREITEQ